MNTWCSGFFTTEMSFYFLHIKPADKTKEGLYLFLHLTKMCPNQKLVKTSVLTRGSSSNVKCISSWWYVASIELSSSGAFQAQKTL